MVSMFRNPVKHKISLLEYALRMWGDNEYLETCGLPSASFAQVGRTAMLLKQMFGLDEETSTSVTDLMAAGARGATGCASGSSSCSPGCAAARPR